MRGQAGAERGIILEIHGREAVVLTPAGDFRRVRLDRPGRQVGDEVPLGAGRAPFAPTRLIWSGVATAVAAAALLALALFPSITEQSDAPDLPGGVAVATRVMAYVTVDINPSFELAVNGAGRVVAARALNSDAEALLALVDTVTLPIEDAVAGLAEAAAERGFLAPERDNNVVIAAVPAEGAPDLTPAVRDRVQAGRDKVKDALSRRSLEAEVVALAAPAPELKEEAARAGLSVGKYLILMEMQKTGLPATVEDLRDRPVGQAIKEYGLKPGEVIRRAEKDEEMKEIIRSFRERLRSEGRQGQDTEDGGNREDRDRDRVDSPGKDKPGKRDGLPPGDGEREPDREKEKPKEKEQPRDRGDGERGGEDRETDGLSAVPEGGGDDSNAVGGHPTTESGDDSVPPVSVTPDDGGDSGEGGDSGNLEDGEKDDDSKD